MAAYPFFIKQYDEHPCVVTFLDQDVSEYISTIF